MGTESLISCGGTVEAALGICYGLWLCVVLDDTLGEIVRRGSMANIGGGFM